MAACLPPWRDGLCRPLRHEVNLDGLGEDAGAALFSEELGAVVQVPMPTRKPWSWRAFAEAGLDDCLQSWLGRPHAVDGSPHQLGGETLLTASLFDWLAPLESGQLPHAAAADDPACADEALDAIAGSG
jgi:hypothetical protein